MPQNFCLPAYYFCSKGCLETFKQQIGYCQCAAFEKFEIVGKMKNEKYIPALSYDWLTAFYDPVVRLTTREIAFKKTLIEQAQIAPFNRVLDLACGTI